MRGVCLIAYGDKAEEEAQQCVKSLRCFHDWPVAIQNYAPPEVTYTNVQKSRWAKVTLDRWSPFDDTLYLDADTRVHGDLSVGFEILEDGFDMVIIPSNSQGADNMWHIADDEREATYAAYQCGEILQWQGGVFWFRKSRAMDFFEAWRTEWLRWRQFDQAALLRALHCVPLKIHALSKAFNGGAVVTHRHGSVK